MRDGLEVPVFDDVREAARRLDGWAVRTPLLNNPALDAALGGRVLIKPEVLQRTGSFKFRGAFNALSRLSDAQKARGVVAFSSGNHAQGVAEAARLLGIRARIVMPHDAPAVKAEGVRTRGAEVIGYDRETEDREQICTRLAQETGAAIIPSFDHPDIIAGQGTCGLEIFEDLAARGEVLENLQPARALSGDDVGMVEGGNDRRAGLLREAGADLLAILGFPVIADHLCAARAHPFGLHRRRVVRHHDARADAEQPRRLRDALGVIAGRERDDAPGLLRIGQPRERIECAAELERAGALQDLRLDQHASAERRVERRIVQQRRAHRPTVEAARGLPHVVEYRHLEAIAHGFHVSTGILAFCRGHFIRQKDCAKRRRRF